MKTLTVTRTMLFIVFALCLQANAQVWNSNAGGYNTGYGTVYGSLGYATATQNLYNSVQMQIRRLEARQMMIKQFGKAAVEKSEREARSGKTTNAGGAQAGPIIADPPPARKNYGLFRPDPTVDTGKLFADSLAESPEEKKIIRNVYEATKTAYEQQTASRGWKNNFAGALTFFAVAAVTVRNDAGEPSDRSVDDLFQAFDLAIDDVPEFARITNREKQQFNNVMIGFGGLLLAGYTEGKQNQDPETIKAYGQLASELIKMVFKIDPDRLKIKDGSIVIE